MKKKIMFVTDAWLPQVNGVVKCIQEMQKHLQERGFEVTVIHPGLFHSMPLFFYPEIQWSLFAKQKIVRALEETKPDYIHIFTEGPIGFSMRSICRKSNRKFTTSIHTNFQYYVRYYSPFKIQALSSLMDKYMAWFHNAGSGTMVATESLKKELEKKGFSKVRIWPLGVDVELFTRRADSPVKNDARFKSPVFAYLGRVAKEKNIEEYLKSDLPGTKLVIGDGPLKKRFESEYGKTAIFLGYKKGSELVDVLSACDVFVFPSVTETFGLVILEALACGLPVAAHDVMGPRDIITDGRDGFLDSDLKRAAMKCLELSRDDCRKKAEAFSWASSADQFSNNLVEAI